jgi:hypothetical protein
MILTGEHDFLTPRPLQESLRSRILDSRLVIIPHAYHAFTLEKPGLTAYLVTRFAEDVMAGRWHGKGSIWVAPEDIGGELAPFPEGFDHMRAIPVRTHAPELAPQKKAIVS